MVNEFTLTDNCFCIVIDVLHVLLCVRNSEEKRPIIVKLFYISAIWPKLTSRQNDFNFSTIICVEVSVEHLILRIVETIEVFKHRVYSCLEILLRLEDIGPI